MSTTDQDYRGGVLTQDEEATEFKWHITPHPYDSDYDVLVTNDDDEAQEAVLRAAEDAFDQVEVGFPKSITVTLNPKYVEPK